MATWILIRARMPRRDRGRLSPEERDGVWNQVFFWKAGTAFEAYDVSCMLRI